MVALLKFQTASLLSSIFFPNVAYYTMIDTLDTREIRTFINIDTQPIPELLKAEGKDLNSDEIKKELNNTHYNFIDKIFIKQTPGIEITLDINNCELFINSKKAESFTNLSEIPESEYAKYKGNLSLAQKEGVEVNHLKEQGISFYRHRFIISNRLEHEDLKKSFTYSRRNWDLYTCNIHLLDDIKIITTSRANAFNLSFPHEWKKLHGALVRQSDANEISSISECTNI